MGGEKKNSDRPVARSQIALEFMIVYSIVLIIFVVVFAVIANERSVSLAQQQSVLMQLIAQSVAGYINQALQAGSGYSIIAPLSAGIGYIPYNISVSTTGLIFANTTVGKERIVGEAASSARNLAVNGTPVSSANGIVLYVLPLYAGYLTITNAGGIIYIDKLMPSLPSLAENLSLFQQASINAPHFTASSSSVVVVANSPTLKVPSSITLDAWVYMSTIQAYPATGQVNVANPIVGEFGHSSQPFMLAVTNYGAPSFVTNDGNKMLQGSPDLLSTNILYNIAATYNSSGSTATIYINGNPVASNTFSVGGFEGPSNLTIGGAPANGTYFNGYISGVQVYNASLSQQQIAAIYSNGPSSAPTNLVSGLVGWWPLNGNFNDYSGKGNTGTPYNAPLTSVIALQARVSSFGGYPLSGVPLGFWSTNGLLGSYNSIATTTGSNGLQDTLLVSNGISGRFQAQSIYFNGNLTTTYNLKGWWPLDIGNSNTIYDYSGSGDNGTFTKGAYGYLPNESATLTAQFNGASSSISVANAPGLSPTNVTIAAWFEPTTTSSERIVAKPITVGKGDDYDLYSSSTFLGSRLTTSSGTSYYQASTAISPDTWYFGAAAYQSSTNTISIYMNGKLIGTSNSVVSGALSSSSNSLTIGSGYSTYWTGNISDVQIYNTTLSASQISELYSEGMIGTPVPNEGLVGWWPMTGSGANYAALQSPYSITSTGVVYNSVVYSSSPSAQSPTLLPLFNGVSNYISLPAVSTLKPTNTVTLTMWVYESSLWAGNFVNDGCNFGGCYDMILDHGYFDWNIWNSGTRYEISAGGISAGAWYFLAGTFNGSDMYFYVNGQGVGSPIPATLSYNSPSFIIGKPSGSVPPYSIVDFQIYNTSLTNGQIEQLYQQGFPTPTITNASVG